MVSTQANHLMKYEEILYKMHLSLSCHGFHTNTDYINLYLKSTKIIYV